jgi:site-specific recombinase XerD
MARIKATSTGKRTRSRNVNVSVDRHLTPDQVEQLMQAARKHSFYAQRDAAMILLTYEHGLRVSELCGLLWSQVDLKAATLSVQRVKGGISTLHPLTGRGLRALRALDRERASLPWVFTSEQGGQMTPAGVRYLLRRLGKLAALKRSNPHSLRHACGYKLVNQGTDIRLVQSYLGHADIQSTLTYTKVDTRRFRGLF